MLHVQGERKDLHGRILGKLWSNGRYVDPITVLGLFAIDKARHEQEHKWIKANRALSGLALATTIAVLPLGLAAPEPHDRAKDAPGPIKTPHIASSSDSPPANPLGQEAGPYVPGDRSSCGCPGLEGVTRLEDQEWP